MKKGETIATMKQWGPPRPELSQYEADRHELARREAEKVCGVCGWWGPEGRWCDLHDRYTDAEDTCDEWQP